MKKNIRSYSFYYILSILLFPLQIFAQNSYIYGITDGNEIYEIDMVNKTNTRVYNTGLAGSSNAFAFDNTRNHFFFIDPSKNLNFWDRGSAFTQIATAAQLDLSTRTIPANAAYYDNAFWFFNDGTSILNKISLNYSGSIPSFASRTTYTITGTPSPNSFGDIAITSSGMLYAATTGGVLYTLNLATLGSSVAVLNSRSLSPAISLQIGFSSDETILFGHSYNTGIWYSINTSTGVLTQIETSPGTAFTSQFPTNGLRDISDMAANTPVNTVDMQVSITNNQSSYLQGAATTYTVVVTNANISGSIPVIGALLNVTPASGISFGSWTITYSGGAASASGSGTISNYTLATMPVGSTATITINATFSGSATGSQQTTARVINPANYSDINAANNNSADTDLLPVIWGSFTARVLKEDVLLQWSTLQEINTKDFIIQRSLSGQPWTSIKTIPAAGFTQTKQNYSFTDLRVPNGQLSYRILQRDLDEKFEYSAIRTVDIQSSKQLITILGNPVLNGSLKLKIREKGILSIRNSNGQLLLEKFIDPGEHVLDVNKWSKGFYHYSFQADRLLTDSFIIQ
jgi:hypothetical protein